MLLIYPESEYHVIIYLQYVCSFKRRYCVVFSWTELRLVLLSCLGKHWFDVTQWSHFLALHHVSKCSRLSYRAVVIWELLYFILVFVFSQLLYVIVRFLIWTVRWGFREFIITATDFFFFFTVLNISSPPSLPPKQPASPPPRYSPGTFPLVAPPLGKNFNRFPQFLEQPRLLSCFCSLHLASRRLGRCKR